MIWKKIDDKKKIVDENDGDENDDVEFWNEKNGWIEMYFIYIYDWFLNIYFLFFKEEIFFE